MKIYEIADKWLNHHKMYIREKTIQNYAYAIKRFKRYFSDVSPELITKDYVYETFKVMADEYGKNSIYNVRQIMSAVYASELPEIVNPFKRLPIPSNREKIVEAYTIAEQRAIISACKDDILGDVYIFLLLTGLRRSELINLRWEDYNQEHHCISIRTAKTDAGIRTTALMPQAELILQSQTMQTHGYIFSTTKKTRISVSSLKKLYLRLEKKVGFDLTNHKCRHTYCTRLVEAKVDYKTIAQMSGHSSVAFLMQRYVSSDLELQYKAIIISG